MRHAVLMGDPYFFRIKGGNNPYTRNHWGVRKRVDRERAIFQWQSLRETFESLGAKVFILAPREDLPGLAFPANAGFLYPKLLRPLHESSSPLVRQKTDESVLRRMGEEKGGGCNPPHPNLPPRRGEGKTDEEAFKSTFYLSNLTGHRAGEQAVYREFFSELGFRLDTLPYPFEGEADFFPCGASYIFTYGTVRPTGFRLRFGWPPYEYQFSHRSDERNEKALQKIVGGRPILKVRLIDVRYYHGDTCLFAFGPKREHLFAYLDAVDEESRGLLQRHLGNRLIPLAREEAQNFVANSVQIETESGPHIVFPVGVSDEVKRKVSSLGISFTTVDVSEFFEKGGGSVKCMICDLGPLV
ncbi:MAG: hypothetical protein HY584_04740 [Candidatus Omnitrophica bacterium]|nr:hypothetical protein [Candidatus Omnitrophota bacterium]